MYERFGAMPLNLIAAFAPQHIALPTKRQKSNKQ
nr:MAG TPA: hypothetical protein [Caudoviricetes sp.]